MTALCVRLMGGFYFLILALMAAIGLSAWPVLDDFGLMNDLHSIHSVFGMTKHWYLTWSGRVLSTTIVAFFFSLPDRFLPYVSALNGILFVLTAWVSTWIVAPDLKKQRLAVAAILLTTFSVGTLPFVSQCVFWASGGVVYAHCLFLGAIWLALLLNPSRSLRWPLWVALSILTGITHELLILSLGFMGAWSWLFAQKGSSHRKWIALGLFGLLIGGLILFLAPGNYHRNSLTQSVPLRQHLNFLWHHIPSTAHNYYELFVRRPLRATLILSVLCSILFITQPTQKHRFTPLVLGAGLLLSVFPALALIYFMNAVGTTTERMWFFPVSFFVLGIWSVSRGSVEKIWSWQLLTARGEQVTRILAALVLVGAATRHVKHLSEDLRIIQNYRKEVVASLETLQKLRGSQKAVVLQAIPAEKPKRLLSMGLSKDPSYYVNGQLARYYGLQSIRVEDAED